MTSIQAPLTEATARRDFRYLTILWWATAPFNLLPQDSCALLLLSLALACAATVYGCILLYRQWALLEGHGARTDAAKAVGYGFIPIYCFYWWFVSLVGLAQDTNRHLDKTGIRGARMSEELALAVCVQLIGCIPLMFHQQALAIHYSVLMATGFLLALQQQQCVLAILAHRRQAVPDNVPPLPADGAG